MRNILRSFLIFPFAVAMAVMPSVAESPEKTKPKHQDDSGVQDAIAYQRAKDRADAAQARKEARHPEQFTYAQPKRDGDDSLANQQRREALEHAETQSDKK